MFSLAIDFFDEFGLERLTDNALSNVANALGNILPMHSKIITAPLSNGLKNVQCIFQRIFNGFLTYLLCRVFANRVTYRLTHPMETAIRRLVSIDNFVLTCLLVFQ